MPRAASNDCFHDWLKYTLFFRWIQQAVWYQKMWGEKKCLSQFPRHQHDVFYCATSSLALGLQKMTRLIDCQSGRWLNKVVVNHTSSGRSGNGKQKCPQATFETFRMCHGCHQLSARAVWLTSQARTHNMTAAELGPAALLVSKCHSAFSQKPLSAGWRQLFVCSLKGQTLSVQNKTPRAQIVTFAVSSLENRW